MRRPLTIATETRESEATPSRNVAGQILATLAGIGEELHELAIARVHEADGLPVEEHGGFPLGDRQQPALGDQRVPIGQDLHLHRISQPGDQRLPLKERGVRPTAVWMAFVA